MNQSERFTHAETQEHLRKHPMSQKEAIQSTMEEFDARLEEIQSLCGNSFSKQTAARIKSIRTLLSHEIG